MRKDLIAVALVALSACAQESSETASPPGNDRMSTREPSAPPAASVAEARMVEEKGDLIEFTYGWPAEAAAIRSEEHTSELQSLMRISYAVFCLKKKNQTNITTTQKNNNQT